MRVLSLFSGIGGLDLAAEWADMKTVAFCEIDDYASKVLERRWPGVPIYRDVRELTREQLEKDGLLPIDVIVGGFPCQDVSCAGKRTGFHNSEGEVTRSGLWAEHARIIGEVKPRWVVAENVRGLLSIPALGRRGGGFGIILRDLADLGYSVGWCCYGASDIGAPHRRDRVFIIANRGGCKVADSDSAQHIHRQSKILTTKTRFDALGKFEPMRDVADPGNARL
jgi:DNA (cytosine-5)-methyltransferase 1